MARVPGLSWQVCLLAAGAAWLVVVRLAVPAEAGHPVEVVRVLVAAYRGGALLWPENSLRAFRGALALGVEYLQLDVHLSRDGEVVVIHDATLDRTTSGAGPVRDRSLAELQAFRLKDASGAAMDEAVPTLAQVLELTALASRQLLIEIKVGPDQGRYPGIEDKVVSLLDRHRMTGSVVVMAQEAETWRRLRALRPQLRTGLLYPARTHETSGRPVSAALNEAVRGGAVLFGLHQALVTPAVALQARQSGVFLGVWPVNDVAVMRRLVDMGVGLIISERPDLARHLTRR